VLLPGHTHATGRCQCLLPHCSDSKTSSWLSSSIACAWVSVLATPLFGLKDIILALQHRVCGDGARVAVLAISCGSSHVLPGEPIPRVMGGALLLNGRRHLRRPHTQTTGAAGVSEAGTAAAGWPAGRLAGWLATLAGWLGGAHRLGDGVLAELDLLGAAVGGAPALHKVPEAPAGVAEPHGHTEREAGGTMIKQRLGKGLAVAAEVSRETTYTAPLGSREAARRMSCTMYTCM
jgi:hypothetical protein